MSISENSTWATIQPTIAEAVKKNNNISDKKALDKLQVLVDADVDVIKSQLAAMASQERVESYLHLKELYSLLRYGIDKDKRPDEAVIQMIRDKRDMVADSLTSEERIAAKIDRDPAELKLITHHDDMHTEGGRGFGRPHIDIPETPQTTPQNPRRKDRKEPGPVRRAAVGVVREVGPWVLGAGLVAAGVVGIPRLARDSKRDIEMSAEELAALNEKVESNYQRQFTKFHQDAFQRPLNLRGTVVFYDEKIKPLLTLDPQKITPEFASTITGIAAADITPDTELFKLESFRTSPEYQALAQETPQEINHAHKRVDFEPYKNIPVTYADLTQGARNPEVENMLTAARLSADPEIPHPEGVNGYIGHAITAYKENLSIQKSGLAGYLPRITPPEAEVAENQDANTGFVKRVSVQASNNSQQAASAHK